MIGLTRLIPSPTRVPLAGRSWWASEFRLGDVAELHRAAEGLAGDPFEAASFELLNRPRDRAWKRLLGRTFEAIEARESDRDGYLDSPRGMAHQVYLSLRREHPDLTIGAVEGLIRGPDAASRPVVFEHEYGRLHRVAWGMDPEQLMLSMIDGPSGGPPREVDWAEIFYLYMKNCRNGPPFHELTLTQFRVWNAAGKDLCGKPDEGQRIRRSAFWSELEHD